MYWAILLLALKYLLKRENDNVKNKILKIIIIDGFFLIEENDLKEKQHIFLNVIKNLFVKIFDETSLNLLQYFVQGGPLSMPC